MLPWKNSWFQVAAFAMVLSGIFIFADYAPDLRSRVHIGQKHTAGKPDSTITNEAFGDWHFLKGPAYDSNGKPLGDQEAIVSDITNASDHTGVAHIDIERDGRQFALALTLPFGVALEANTGIVFGNEKPQVFYYQTCIATGCIASGTVNESWLATFAKAQSVKLEFAGLDGKVMAVPLSSKGFSDALRALTAN